MPSDAKAQKRKQLINRANGVTNEPTVSEGLDYSRELNEALNWHSKNTDSKTRKQWVIKHYKKLKQNSVAEHLELLPDFDFHSLGVLIRLKDIGSYIAEKEELFIETKLKELMAKQVAKPKVVAKPAAVVVNIQDRILEKCREVGGEVEGEIDEYILAGCPRGYELKTPVKTFNAQVAKYVASFIKPRIVEVQAAYDGEDKQLVEGYSNFKRIELKRYIGFLTDIVAKCEEQKVAVKATRKPSVRKPKPAAVQVAKVKFQKEFPELKLKSINASEIIGADELWVYNTKYRRVTVYRSADSNGLAVKGTTLINYTPKGSSTKTLRKPEDFLPKVLSLTKRSLGPEFRNIKTKEAVPNGRLNEETILLKAFK